MLFRAGLHQPGRKRPWAFTLIELLIVVVILGILAAIIIPRFTVAASDAKKNSCAQNVANINTQVEKYYFDQGAWPKADLTDIGVNAAYFPTPIPACPFNATAYALDATTHRVTGHAH